MVVGATGPLTMTLLFKDYQDKDKVVATGAALMSITHFLKVVVLSILVLYSLTLFGLLLL